MATFTIKYPDGSKKEIIVRGSGGFVKSRVEKLEQGREISEKDRI